MNIDESEVSILAREILRLQAKIAKQSEISRAMWLSGYMYNRKTKYNEAEVMFDEWRKHDDEGRN